MPIKPENKALYPKNWPEIREKIRERAGNRCERCRVRNHAVGYRDEDGIFHPCGGNLIMEDYGQGVDPYTGKVLDYKKAKEVADFASETDEYCDKYFVIVCTVAHLDHTPENCQDENLAFLCQKCHNSYDVGHRKQTIRKTRNKGQLSLNI